MPTGLGDEKLWLCPSLDDSADDISGNGNHGTYNGGMGTVADTSNGGSRCYDFDGSNDYIDLSLSSAIGNTFSVSLWIYFDAATASTNETFISNDGWRSGGWLAQKHSTPSFRYAEQGAQPFLDNTGITVNTTWMHLVVVREAGGTVRQYKNGVQLSNTISTFASSITRTIVNIGRRYDIASQYLDGRMDDIRIFDRALSTSEITALASKRGYEVPAVSGSIPHALSSPFHPLG